MHRAPFLLTLPVALATATVALAAITIDTVHVGNPGNAGDPQNAQLRGAVDYEYDLGKYEVTNAQYAAFLNAVNAAGTDPHGLYNPQMMSDALGGINFSSAAANGSKYSIKAGHANNPVVFVNFFDAARFTNWLQNGQGTANTEDGAYRMADGIYVARKITASWCLPTVDEWYKAAYHKNDGPTANYFTYPTASNTAPSATLPPGAANSANYLSAVGNLTDVGAYTLAHSPYGTFDQAGNVWEWTETSPAPNSNIRDVAGGSWFNNATYLASSLFASGQGISADSEASSVGFRVARVVPQLAPGDYNGDGYVDAADYTIWRDTLGSHSDLRANGDNTGSSMNVIDAADYDVWKTNYGQPSGTAAVSNQAVPEPTTGTLLCAAAIFCSPRRKSPLAD
jgi:formylglycine-generating enzyme required for sulfatase activity